MSKTPTDPIHLTASLRAIRPHEPGGMPTISWAERRVLEAAEETTDPDLLRLRASSSRLSSAKKTPGALVRAKSVLGGLHHEYSLQATLALP